MLSIVFVKKQYTKVCVSTLLAKGENHILRCNFASYGPQLTPQNRDMQQVSVCDGGFKTEAFSVCELNPHGPLLLKLWEQETHDLSPPLLKDDYEAYKRLFTQTSHQALTNSSQMSKVDNTTLCTNSSKSKAGRHDKSRTD